MVVFTDLDGTLLNSEQKFSDEDYQTLEELGAKNIIRVVATGRHIFSAKKVMGNSFPIDYLIFSTGAGIMNWKTGEIIFKSFLEKSKVQQIADILIQHKSCFSVHNLIPDDHYYQYYKPFFNDDFENRNSIYRDYNSDFKEIKELNDCSRFIAVLSEKAHDFDFLKNELFQKIEKINIIKASSPLNGKNIWLEIYSEKISKGFTAKWLCDYLGINVKNTLGVGNDYNDIDLLDFTAESFIVENAPDELKSKYQVVKSNNYSGFSEAVKKMLNLKSNS